MESYRRDKMTPQPKDQSINHTKLLGVTLSEEKGNFL